MWQMPKSDEELRISKIVGSCVKALADKGIPRDRIDADYKKMIVWVDDVRIMEADTAKHRRRREQKQRREREESILAEEEEAAAAAEELQEKSRALLTRNEAKKLAPMAHYPE